MSIAILHNIDKSYNIQDASFDENGIYYAEDEGVSGYKEVTIDVPDTLFQETVCGDLTGVTANDFGDITELRPYAFYEYGENITGPVTNNGITAVEMSDSIQKVGEYAFYNCDKLTNVSIGEVTGYIGIGAFEGCSSLDSATFNGAYGWYVADSSMASTGTAINESDLLDPSTASTYLSTTYKDKYWLRGTAGLEYTLLADDTYSVSAGTTTETKIFIPSNYNGKPVSTIAINGFRYLTSLTELVLNKNIKDVKNSAFNATYANFNNLYYAGTLEEWCDINYIALASCPAIRAENTYINGKLVAGTLIVPLSVTSIKTCTFAGLKSVETFILHKNVESIGAHAFMNCDDLSSMIIYAATPPTIVSSIFDSLATFPIYVLAASVDAYKAASGWSDYADRIQAISE